MFLSKSTIERFLPKWMLKRRCFYLHTLEHVLRIQVSPNIPEAIQNSTSDLIQTYYDYEINRDQDSVFRLLLEQQVTKDVRCNTSSNLS